MLDIIITNQAEADLYHVWYFIAIENSSPDNTERLINKLDAIFRLIAKNPKIGTDKSEYLKGIRQYVFENYLVFYQFDDGVIEIVRVIQGNRNIPDLF
jgi:toxin ParE1/3/4